MATWRDCIWVVYSCDPELGFGPSGLPFGLRTSRVWLRRNLHSARPGQNKLVKTKTNERLALRRFAYGSDSEMLHVKLSSGMHLK